MSSLQKTEEGCVVCCRKSSIHAVGPCDHRVCFICSARMRTLCLKNECPICRQDMPNVIFTKTEHSYATLAKQNYRMDHKFKICFADDEIEAEYAYLLEDRCPICPDQPSYRSFGHLKDHLRKQHEMYYCDLCVEHLKLFTYERRCYSRKDLARHKRKGDVDNTSHKGHPLCKFCEQHYVDKDDLYRHVRKDHYYCHFCDADGINLFYAQYSMLYEHFQEDHFVCEEGSCQNDQYTGIFRSDIDLIAHKASHHSKNLTKLQAKQARTLELNFSIAPRNSHQNGNLLGETERERRGGRRGPHERDSRAEMTMYLPEREGLALPEPEAVVINMQCVRDFPHLSATSGPSNMTQEHHIKVKNHPCVQSPKWKGAAASYEDNFPSLTTSSPSTASGNKMLLKFQNSDYSFPHRNTSNISIKVSNKAKPSDKGKTTAGIPQTTLTISQTSHPISSSVSSHSSNSFEQHFPRLGGEESVRTTMTVPVWQVKEPKPAKLPEFTVVANKKNKKKVDVISVQEVQSKQKENVDNGNKKKKKDRPKENSHSVKTVVSRIDCEDGSTPLTSNVEQTESDIDCVDGTNELQQKTLTLAMDDFPALESGSNSTTHVPPGFQTTKHSKKAQPPPGFGSSKPNINISLSSVAKELTMNNGNNSSDTSTFATNNSNSSFAINALYLEPQDFQIRNQNLIQEIQLVLQNNMPVFNQFKSISGQFRRSQVSPMEYYNKCIELFGKEHFNKILPELLVLLPDITKQQELLSIYNKCKKRDAAECGAVPKNGSWNIPSMQFMVCASCQQVLCNRDFRDHMASHSSDFTSLRQPNRTAT